MKVVAYTRVSTAEQGNSGLSLEAQHELIARFCAVHDLELAGSFQDVQSGKGVDAIERRPGLRDAFSAAKRLKGAVVVSKLCRLSRETAFIANLMAGGGKFISVEDGLNPNPMIVQIKSAVNEDERRKISERTRLALAVKRQQPGVKLGNRTNLAEAQSKGRAANVAASVAFARRMMPVIGKLRDTSMSLNTIATRLNEMRVPTMRGGSWTAKAVSRVIAAT